MEGMESLYDALKETGAAHGIVNFGLYAMNAMRMEKGYKGWGAELTTEVTRSRPASSASSSSTRISSAPAS